MSFDLKFERRLQELAKYHEQHGDCLVPLCPGPNLGLGIWVETQRLQKRYFQKGNEESTLNPARIAALDKLDFDWDPDEKYVQADVASQDVRPSEEAIDHEKTDNKTEENLLSVMPKLPQENLSDAEASNDESVSAKVFSDGSSDDENASDEDSHEESDSGTDLNETDDFVKRWDLRYEELKRHMASHYPNGGFVANCKCEKQLGNWVGWQRYQYRKKKLDLERIARLEKLGFLWEDTTAANEAAEEGSVDAPTEDMTEEYSQEHQSDAESRDDESSEEDADSNGSGSDAEESDNENGPDPESNSDSDDGSDAQSNNDHSENDSDDEESNKEKDDSDSESHESDNEAGSSVPWDGHFKWLESHMDSLYPNGGYVKIGGSIPATKRNWILQQRYQYRLRQAGRPHTITASRIQRLEDLGFWWESDQPIARKQEEKPPEESNPTPKPNKKKGVPRSKWNVHFGKLKSFMRKHGILETGGFVDASWCKKGFANWVIKQREDYEQKMQGMDSDITDEQIEKLESIGFHWRRKEDLQSDDSASIDTGRRPPTKKQRRDQESTESETAEVAKRIKRTNIWEHYFERLRRELEALPEVKDNYYPPCRKTDTKYYFWCTQQRYQYRLLQKGKKSVLVDDQIQRLKDIGFLQESEPAATEGGQASDEDDDHSISDSEEDDEEYVESSRRKSPNKSSNKKATSKQTPPKPKPGAKIPWEVHYETLVRFMKKHCPNGGFVCPPTTNMKFYNWVCSQRSLYRNRGTSKLLKLPDDRVEKLEQLGFLWEKPLEESEKSEQGSEDEEEEDESEKSEESEEEDEESDSEMEQDSSLSSEEDDSEQEESESSTASGEEEEKKPGRHRKRARRKSHANPPSPNVSAYKSLDKKEILRLFMNQMDHLEMLRKEKVGLRSELEVTTLETEKYKTRLSKSKDKNDFLKIKIKDLKKENQKLADDNTSLTQCNHTLRQSHKKSMLEERAHIQRETKRRKLAEDQLEKAKKLIPFELDDALLR